MMGQLLFQMALLSVLIVIGLVILFIPAFIAFRRQHPNRWAIAVICLAFGGTIIGWFGAFVWAMQTVHLSPTGSHGGESGLNIFVNDPVTVRVEPSALSPTEPAPVVDTDELVARLARLKRLAEQGAISNEEHSALRKSILAALVS